MQKKHLQVKGGTDMNIYEINNAFREWESKIMLQDGEVTDEDFAELEQLKLLAEDKVDGYAVLIKESLAEAEILKQEAKKLEERAKRKTNLAERLKANLDFFMQSQGKEKFSSSKAEISYRTSEILQIEEDIKLAKKWYRIKQEIDKTAIKDFIKAGGKVKGCEIVKNKKIQVE